MARGKRMREDEKVNRRKQSRYTDDTYEETSRKKKTKKKMNKGLKVFLIILLVLFIIILGVAAGGFGYLQSKLGKINYDKEQINVDINEGIDEKLKGYRSIALFGIDSADDEYGKGNRSDSIIIITINEKTKEVDLTSVYRDTYLEITGRDLDKVNHAYSYGGPELALSTINTNLDLNIKEYVVVNFDSVAEIIDSVGGVEIEVTSEELKYINNYITDVSNKTGRSAKEVTTAGKQTLNGVQATAYGRIRYTSGGDYKRTERMRTVIEATMAKAQKMNMGQLLKLVDVLLPKVRTNISSGEIIALIPSALSMKIDSNIGWPYDTKGKTINGVWYGPPVTLEFNVKKLHNEVFGETDYEPSSKVKSISNKIINKTGYK